MSGYRSAQLFVQPKTVRLLRLATKLYPKRGADTPPEGISPGDFLRTPDELGDFLIREAIAEKYPLAAKLALEQDKLEKAFINQAKK